MKTNGQGKKLIKESEGLRLTSYPDGGCLAIGYGTTRINGQPVAQGMTITLAEAEKYFEQDLAFFETGVAKYVKVPLTLNQFSALVSFSYNLGLGSLQKSTLLKKLNAGDYAGAADEFGRWVHAGGKVLQGLVTRRQREKELFLS